MSDDFKMKRKINEKENRFLKNVKIFFVKFIHFFFRIEKYLRYISGNFNTKKKILQGSSGQ